MRKLEERKIDENFSKGPQLKSKCIFFWQVYKREKIRGRIKKKRNGKRKNGKSVKK